MFFHRFKTSAALSAAVICTSTALASTAPLTGRVTDAGTELALSGARIWVEGTTIETFTNQSGDYTLTAVPVGEHKIRVSYLGYDDRVQSATIAERTVNTLNVRFADDTVQLDKLVITGSAVGTARAINQQRAATTLTSIVAADEIGRFPDQNAAESLQRLPGLSLYRDQGEGRFINLRGLNYIYTSVSLDGAPVASPELGDRAIALDVVPSDALASIEVTKVPTPDQAAGGLGGQINIKSRSAFDSTHRELSVTTQGIYTRLTDKFNSKLNAAYSHLFANNTIGLVAGLTWQERDFGSHNFEEDGWSQRTLPSTTTTFFAPDAIGFRDYMINRERFGANAALEFKPSASAYYFLRATYNRFTDTEDRHQLYIPFSRGALTALSANSGTLDNISRVRRDLRIREKEQELLALSSGFEHQFDQWKIDGLLNHSKGIERRPGETTIRFRRNTGDSDLRYTFNNGNPFDLSIEQLAGASITDPASYTALDRLEVQNNRGEETETGFALNALRNLDTAQPASMKFGVSYRAKDKESDVNIERFTAPSTFTFASVAGRVNPDYPFGAAVPRIDHDAVLAAFNGNRAAFTASVLQPDSTLEDWRSAEDILGAYGQGQITLGKTSLLGGLRYERTKFDSAGNQIRGSVITPTSVSRRYDNWLPGLHLRHDFNKRFVARLSYSQSLTRPAFGETAIYRNVVDNDTEVEAGNPALETLESRNWDASLEYYLPSLGTVSAAVFHKDVKNFSYVTSIAGGDPSLPTYDLITYTNGSDATIRGLELAYQHQLRFLPAPFDGLGFMSNVTLVDAEAIYPNRPGEKLPLIGQSDVTGNLALTYEKRGFFVRLALNWRDAHLREDEPFGDDSDGDRYIDDYYQLDLSTSYRINRHLEAFAEFTNLTNEPFRVYFNSSNGQGPRLVQHEEYDWSANVGLRWKL